MIVLGLDTSTVHASVALVIDGVIAATATRDAGRGARSGEVLLAVDEACRAAAIGPRQLDAVAIGAGPGSFTGLRVGMATAKGIAFAAGKPLWAVSSLGALAFAATGDGPIVAVLDARRGEVFAGWYRRAGAAVELTAPERVLSPEALLLDIPADASCIGDAIGAHPALAPLATRWQIATPSGSNVALLALAGARADVLVSGAPTYIRASEAEIRYPDGVPGALRKRDGR